MARNRAPISGRYAAAILLLVAAIPLALAAQETRELTVTGCLLSNGYAGFQLEDATIEAIDGKAVTAEIRSSGPAKWVLDGAGNLRKNIGEKVQVVGRSTWRAGAEDQPGTPHLEVTSLKTIAASCK